MHDRSGGIDPGRDGCRVPLPWSGTTAPFGFSPAEAGAPPWLPQPGHWAGLTVEAEEADPDSMLRLYRRRAPDPAIRARPGRWPVPLARVRPGRPGLRARPRIREPHQPVGDRRPVAAPPGRAAGQRRRLRRPPPARRDGLAAPGPRRRGGTSLEVATTTIDTACRAAKTTSSRHRRIGVDTHRGKDERSTRDAV